MPSPAQSPAQSPGQRAPGQRAPGQRAPGQGAPHDGADPSGAEHRPAAGFDSKGRVKRGRVSALWIGLIASAIFLILLIIFIAQNLTKASIHFLGLAGHLPVGLIVLISAIVGLLLAAIPGSIRILQLRKSLKHNTPKDQRTV